MSQSSLIKLFQNISVDTWERLIFSYNADIKYSEVTITENLLFNLHQYNLNNSSNLIRLYEAKNENVNGNDLEIFLEVGENEYILLVVQAKKIDMKSKKYRTISHKVKTDYQIDLLEKYATSKSGVPLYLFYNYDDDFNKKYFGCTFICSNHIKNNYYKLRANGRWKIPSFKDLHLNSKDSIPLLFLALQRCFKNFIDKQCSGGNAYNIFSLDEINDSSWIEISEVKNIVKIKEADENIDFRPKYRLILRK